jgi:amino acid transporter
MGGFQNFGISFTIISILAGCLTSYYIAFNQGGPIAITWGWLIVGRICTVVALALGEITSRYPTAGGPYHWASKLGSPAWGWFTGWFPDALERIRRLRRRHPDRGDRALHRVRAADHPAAPRR